MTDFRVYDVFTDRAFGGNQLAVITDAAGLPEQDLQRIAREFNFSETTFVYPPGNAAYTAKVRIFTPTMEIPFAGHPTIGTAIALRDLGAEPEMTLELGVGPIPCHADAGAARFTTTAALERLATPDPALVAAALGLPQNAISTATHAPVQASLGLPFVLVELSAQHWLDQCMPVTDQIRLGAQTHPAGLDFALFPYVANGDVIHARMFAPLDNIPEDPATGSAAATLAALLTEARGADQDLTIHQGVQMGRPSVIRASTQHGDTAAITISGRAILTMKGTLEY
ncbi:PhzF family phenazine biosynthesis protein [Yoonia sp. SS1-5]|uniref:PhzF family phenazine biosynthesis protein n=1 Tax=Yoonia rhodophyticola TaxID=3137370 RepID=A0AAN0NJT3_9RHOB